MHLSPIIIIITIIIYHHRFDLWKDNIPSGSQEIFTSVCI